MTVAAFLDPALSLTVPVGLAQCNLPARHAFLGDDLEVSRGKLRGEIPR